MGVKKFWLIAVVALLGVLACGVLLAGCGQTATSSASKASVSSSSKAIASDVVTAVDPNDPDAKYSSGKHHIMLTVEGYDPVTIELDADSAPVSVWNLCKLANEGYYNGKTFYRFVDGFCMQGGTKGNIASGKDDGLKKIVGEFSANGIDNQLADNFKKGTVAMARTNDPNSAGSTFFVTLDTSASVSQSLNGLYAAFGTIDDAGMAIVDQIVADYLPNVTDRASGAIADESKQAKIVSMSVLD